MGNPQGLDRREILRRAMLMTGMALMPGQAMAAVAGAAKTAVLDKPGIALVGAVADTIIPVTDTPGALAVGVPGLIETMLEEWASPDHRTLILATLKRIDDAARDTEGKGFAALSPDSRYAVLSKIDATSVLSDPGYGMLKNLVVTLYYLSEVGSTVELRYEHVPGRWDPSLPVTPETRTQGGAVMM